MLKNALYIVPTPIGNMSDITFRAVEVLKAATLIAAEDTRHTKILLDNLVIQNKKLLSCHDHNEESRAEIIENEIKNNNGIVALVSDAGTPLISDPGYRVVSILVKKGIDVIPLPGPCAAITALSASGLSTDKFSFKGFLPVKEKELREKIEALKNVDETTVFYESPRRILTTLKLMQEIIPNRDLVLAREISKTFETFYREKASNMKDLIASNENNQKGEFVLMVGKDESEESLLNDKVKECLNTLAEFVPTKLLCAQIANITDCNKNELYQYILDIKNK